MPDWVSTIAIGRDKLKSPQSEKKRHDRSEKREAIYKTKATDVADTVAANTLSFLIAITQGVISDSLILLINCASVGHFEWEMYRLPISHAWS